MPSNRRKEGVVRVCFSPLKKGKGSLWELGAGGVRGALLQKARRARIAPINAGIVQIMC